VRVFTKTFCVALIIGSVASPAVADDTAGAYLALRHSLIERDYGQTAMQAERVLKDDPSNVELLETAVSARISAGQFTGLETFVDDLMREDPENTLGALATIALLIRDEDFDGLLAFLGEEQKVSVLVDKLIRGWALVGTGNVTGGVDTFVEASGPDGAVNVIGGYNAALATALVGDFETALEHLGPQDQIGSRGSLRARLQILSNLERHEEALALLMSDGNAARLYEAERPAIERALKRGKALDFDVIETPAQGMAETLYILATALDGQAEDALLLLYGRVAQAIRQDASDYTLYVGEVLTRMDNSELALKAYDNISQKDPAYVLSAMRRGEILRDLEQLDESLEVLSKLTKSYSDNPRVHRVYGQTLSADEQHAQAADAYERALKLAGDELPNLWLLHFQLAIAYERQGKWSDAEPNFRAALALEPDQPNVLNYLGYSLLDRKEKLDEALAMIQKAIEGRPDSGAIIDSLAWGLFSLARYDEAVGSHLILWRTSGCVFCASSTSGSTQC